MSCLLPAYFTQFYLQVNQFSAPKLVPPQNWCHLTHLPIFILLKNGASLLIYQFLFFSNIQFKNGTKNGICLLVQQFLSYSKWYLLAQLPIFVTKCACYQYQFHSGKPGLLTYSPIFAKDKPGSLKKLCCFTP